MSICSFWPRYYTQPEIKKTVRQSKTSSKTRLKIKPNRIPADFREHQQLNTKDRKTKSFENNLGDSENLLQTSKPTPKSTPTKPLMAIQLRYLDNLCGCFFNPKTR
ncbi:hypothetical protein ES332_D10G128300v1 [Gossypium tomentosum]|uniref:Uncharacterized protein n=1 Tax=Gossypium tomentosum TaxID=34277 RepID=A0A5D2J4X9_GOSTO|nr:hypothetical protein ES332_D10G128300v1 [Gossypium tomentosum]